MGRRDELLKIVERTLDEVLPSPSARPTALSEGMRYAVGTGGKRIRPLICLAAAEAVGGKADEARYAAAAIELLHNYTLVHDDLPAMDNDDFRRGQPTVWRKFGEANAILIGDSLQALAFGVAARTARNPDKVVAVLGERGVGVVVGQVEDIGERKDIPFIYEHKTADLFVAAAMMGGYAGGGAANDIDALRKFAFNLGMAFQYEDDVLDGDSAIGVEEAKEMAKKATDMAITALLGLSGDTGLLREIAESLLSRRL